MVDSIVFDIKDFDTKDLESCATSLAKLENLVRECIDHDQLSSLQNILKLVELKLSTFKAINEAKDLSSSSLNNGSSNNNDDNSSANTSTNNSSNASKNANAASPSQSNASTTSASAATSSNNTGVLSSAKIIKLPTIEQFVPGENIRLFLDYVEKIGLSNKLPSSDYIDLLAVSVPRMSELELYINKQKYQFIKPDWSVIRSEILSEFKVYAEENKSQQKLLNFRWKTAEKVNEARMRFLKLSHEANVDINKPEILISFYQKSHPELLKTLVSMCKLEEISSWKSLIELLSEAERKLELIASISSGLDGDDGHGYSMEDTSLGAVPPTAFYSSGSSSNKFNNRKNFNHSKKNVNYNNNRSDSNNFKPVCIDFYNGNCSRPNCKYSHEIADLAKSVKLAAAVKRDHGPQFHSKHVRFNTNKNKFAFSAIMTALLSSFNSNSDNNPGFIFNQKDGYHTCLYALDTGSNQHFLTNKALMSHARLTDEPIEVVGINGSNSNNHSNNNNVSNIFGNLKIFRGTGYLLETCPINLLSWHKLKRDKYSIKYIDKLDKFIVSDTLNPGKSFEFVNCGGIYILEFKILNLGKPGESINAMNVGSTQRFSSLLNQNTSGTAGNKLQIHSLLTSTNNAFISNTNAKSGVEDILKHNVEHNNVIFIKNLIKDLAKETKVTLTNADIMDVLGIYKIHKALSHVSVKAIKESFGNELCTFNGANTQRYTDLHFDLCENLVKIICTACGSGKTTRKSFKNDDFPAESIGHKTVGDIFYINKSTAYLILSDEYSSMTIVKRIKSKSANSLFIAIKEISDIYQAYNHKIQFLYTDNEVNFKSIKLKLQSLGIVLKQSGPEVHVGLVERNIRTLKGMFVSSLQQLWFKLPVLLVDYLMLWIAQSFNLFIHKTKYQQQLSPFTLFTGFKNVNLSNICFEFGQVCYNRTPNMKQKSASKLETNIIIGRDITSFGVYKCLNLDTLTIVDRQQFNEQIISTPNTILSIKAKLESLKQLDFDYNQFIHTNSDDGGQIYFNLNQLCNSEQNESAKTDKVISKSLHNNETFQANSGLELTQVKNVEIATVVQQEQDLNEITENIDFQNNVQPHLVDIGHHEDVANVDGNIQEPEVQNVIVQEAGEQQDDTFNNNRVVDEHQAILNDYQQQEIDLPDTEQNNEMQFQQNDMEDEFYSVSEVLYKYINGKDVQYFVVYDGYPREQGQLRPEDELLETYSYEELDNIPTWSKFKSSNNIPLNISHTKFLHQLKSKNKSGFSFAAVSGNISFKEAMSMDQVKAKNAAINEFKKLVDLNTFIGINYSDMDSDKFSKMAPTFMFFKSKIDQDGKELLKARLIACGNRVPIENQLKSSGNLDAKLLKTSNYSPTASQEAINCVLNLTAFYDMHISICDVNNAFVEALAIEERYVKLDNKLTALLLEVDPSFGSFVTKDGEIYLKLFKSLYGISSSPKAFYNHLSKILGEIGFVACDSDACLFTKLISTDNIKNAGCDIIYDRAIILAHVDDLYISCQDASIIEEVRIHLLKRFKGIKWNQNTDNTFEYLGCTIQRNRKEKSISVSQSTYIKKLLKKYNLQDQDVAVTPANLNLFGFAEDDSMDLQTKDAKKNEYLSLLMAINFIGKYRPDIQTCLSVLSSRVQVANQNDFNRLFRLLKYINLTKSFCMKIQPRSLQLQAYIDSSYANYYPSLHSQHGILVTFGPVKNNSLGFIYSASHKSKSIFNSSYESELNGLSRYVNKILYIRDLCIQLGIPQYGPTKIKFDNLPTIISCTSGFSQGKNSKHLLIKLKSLNQKIVDGLISLEHVDTSNQIADGFTKSLIGTHFRNFRNYVLNCSNKN